MVWRWPQELCNAEYCGATFIVYAYDCYMSLTGRPYTFYRSVFNESMRF